MTYGLTNFDTVEIAKKDKPVIELDVWLGNKNQVMVKLDHDVYKTIPKARKKYLEVKSVYEGPIEAPILENDILGKLIISYKGEIISEHNLLAASNVKRINIISRIIRSINYLIWGDV